MLASVFEPQAIGERLAQARHEAGLTQEEAADLVGVSTRSLQGYEAGDVVPYRHMRKFASVYKRPLEWLLHGEPAEISEDRLAEALEEVAAVRGELAQVRALLERLLAAETPTAQDTRQGS
jgi:transcriptional regulator with XRE-family HTH domain